MKIKRTKILFMINSLRPGGAERVLVNLVNGLNKDKYDITVLTLFGGGANKSLLCKDVRLIEVYKKAPKGFVYITKLFPPKLLHKYFIKEKYDIEVSYLQGVTTRIIGGAPNDVKTIAWMHNFDHPEYAFRCSHEKMRLLKSYSKIVSVSNVVNEKVENSTNHILNNTCVIYNIQDVANIKKLSHEEVPIMRDSIHFKIIAVGTLYNVKGYLRLLKCLLKIHNLGFNFHMYFVGDGPQRKELEQYVILNAMTDYVTFFGYDQNPYKYISKADLNVCSSYTEGFSGTVSEATILGIPTLTTDCAGMQEILGNNNEYGIIVENTDEGLYAGLLDIFENPEKLVSYHSAVQNRIDFFNPKNTIQQTELLLDNIVDNNV
ncbi:MAG: glycosyltransferase [Muribaculum sp.]|nr:glycosyltransferase [Muribaculum sp.]